MNKESSRKLSRKLTVQLLLVFGIFLACLIGFVAIADSVQDGETLVYDDAILTAINAQSTPLWDSFFTTSTRFGGGYTIVAVAIGLSILLAVRRSYKAAITVAVGVAGAGIINKTLKLVFERARPDLWEHLVTETSYSFPSGHAMMSSAIALTIIAISWRTRFRWVVLVLGIIYIAIVGFSRLYLGVHYPTDVLAGWLISSVWVLLVVAVVYQKRILSKF